MVVPVMWHTAVQCKFTDISGKYAAYMFRIKHKLCKEEVNTVILLLLLLLLLVACLAHSSALKEMWVNFYQTPYHNRGGSGLHIHKMFRRDSEPFKRNRCSQHVTSIPSILSATWYIWMTTWKCNSWFQVSMMVQSTSILFLDDSTSRWGCINDISRNLTLSTIQAK